MIDKLNSLPGRALDLVSQVSDGLKHMVPNGAAKWLDTGAKLGALKAGSRVAMTVVRRNPAIAVASVAGVGLLWYLARRRARQAEHAPIEGTATRVDARRSNGQTPAGKRRATTAGTRSKPRHGGQSATT